MTAEECRRRILEAEARYDDAIIAIRAQQRAETDLQIASVGLAGAVRNGWRVWPELVYGTAAATRAAAQRDAEIDAIEREYYLALDPDLEGG